MQFDPTHLAEPAADLRYLPIELHGDEIQSTGGTTYQERQPHEWLDHDQIEDLIRRSPAIVVLVVDDTRGYPPRVYRVAGDPLKAWTCRLSPLYVSDGGWIDADRGWSLLGYRWAPVTGGPDLLVFRCCC